MFKKTTKQQIKLFFLGGFLISLLIGIVGAKLINAIAYKTTDSLVNKTEILTQNNYHLNETQSAAPLMIAFNQVNGFPLGIYDRIDRPEHINTIKSMGFNLIMPYTNPYAKKDYNIIKTYLDIANSAGLKVILEPFRESIKKQDFAEITAFIRTFKNHPAVAGWYSYDEPVYNNISVQLLENVYRLIKTEDPIHPVILDFSGSRSHNLTRYRNSFDICQINQYPLQKKSNALEVLSNVQSEIQAVDRLTNNEPFWLVVQSFQDKKWRLPTIIEQKYLLYSGLVNGADGIFFYGYHRAPENWQNKVVKPSVQELKNYLPAIQQGSLNNGVSSNLNIIQAIAYQQPQTQEYVIIAINHGAKAVQPQIQLNMNHNNSSIEVINENRTLNESQNQFSDFFVPYGVHIYRVF